MMPTTSAPARTAECKIRFQEAIACARLNLIEGAIAPPSAGKSVAFYKSTGNSAWGTIEATWAARNAKLGYNSKTIDLPRVDIGETYRSFGIPFYLKIDVEGMDRLVLDGLTEFEARPRYVSIESEKVDFAELRAEMALLRDLGYTKFKPFSSFQWQALRLPPRGWLPASRRLLHLLAEGAMVEKNQPRLLNCPFANLRERAKAIIVLLPRPKTSRTRRHASRSTSPVIGRPPGVRAIV